MDALKNVLMNTKEEVRKTIISLGIPVDTLFTVLSWFGYTFVPELILNGFKIKYFSSCVGAGVWITTFLIAGQVFGLTGITAHTILYGAGSVLGGTLYLLKE